MVAAPVSARASEQPLGVPLQEPYHRPSTSNSFRSPRQINERTATPSISPLSTASIKLVDVLEPQETAARNGEVSPSANRAFGGSEHVADQAEDDRSSSLSDFEGSFSEQERHDAIEPSSPVVDGENDSEAETERLGRTPQTHRMSLGFGNIGERTPSRLYQQTSYEDNLSEASSTPTGPERESASPSARHGSVQPTELAGKKRKRTNPQSDRDSPLSDASDSDRTVLKRASNGITMDHRERRAASSAKEEEHNEAINGTEEQDAIPSLSPIKAGKLRKSKQRGRPQKSSIPDSTDNAEVEGRLPEDADELLEEDDDDSNDAISAEEVEKRKVASISYSTIAERFAMFKHKLCAERLAAAEAELAQLSQPSPAHPEFLAMLQCITARRDMKINQEIRLQSYKRQTLRNQTIASRSQLHSQYFQEAREIRDDILYLLGKQWYDIQKERRSSDIDGPDQFLYKCPPTRAKQCRAQSRYNSEVSVLAGIAKYVGFPAAPEIEGARDPELDADLKAMEIFAHQPQTVSYKATQVKSAPQSSRAATSEHLAQKEFLEQTPWANPQHPVHQSATPAFGSYALGGQSSHTPFINQLRQASAQDHRTSSPFGTPMMGSRRREDGEAVNAGSSEMMGYLSNPPSSVAPAPPTADRIQLIPYDEVGEGSPTAQPRRANGASNQLYAKRDFSGLSSTSTIEIPSDPADEDHQRSLSHGKAPGYHPEASGSQQTLASGSLHGQDGDERRPESYANADHWRRLGGHRTQMPLATGSMTIGGGSG